MTAAKQGLKSGTYFWPGSEVPIEGVTFVSVMQINTHKHTYTCTCVCTCTCTCVCTCTCIQVHCIIHSTMYIQCTYTMYMYMYMYVYACVLLIRLIALPITSRMLSIVRVTSAREKQNFSRKP